MHLWNSIYCELVKTETKLSCSCSYDANVILNVCDGSWAYFCLINLVALWSVREKHINSSIGAQIKWMLQLWSWRLSEIKKQADMSPAFNLSLQFISLNDVGYTACLLKLEKQKAF